MNLHYVESVLPQFPHQITGTAFLVDRKRALLADDMGLGKSREALDACKNLNLQRILIICPKTLALNWKKQIGLWITNDPSQVIVVEGSYDTRETQITSRKRFTIINYELLQNRVGHSHIATLRAQGFDGYIFDEAHRMKNRKSKTFMGAKGVQTNGASFILTYRHSNNE